MNEVTRIHLGRQPFTASVEAHKELRAYISAIEDQVGDKDVVEEVELRMAELLTERGISGDKVILEPDIAYLKQQLGSPADFHDSIDTNGAVSDSAAIGTDAASQSSRKQLFRDTDNGMAAGVAAGLAAYFGIDVLLVRILFILSILTGGWGLVIYIVLWLVVPPAVTASDRLRMTGAPVTLGNLKDLVDRADAKGTAKRAGNTVAPVINSVFRIILKTAGIICIVASLCVLFGLVALRVYMAAHHGQLFQENLFPVGRSEQLLAYLAMALVGLLAVFGVLCGLAIYKRRWPIRGWITGVIVGIFLIGFAAAGALSVDAVHHVRDRYLARAHTTTRSVQPFQNVTIVGKDVDYRWQYADTYSVSFSYFDNPDISNIKTTVNNNLLTIDTSQYDRDRRCTMLCLFPAYNLLVTVEGPRPLSSDIPTKLPKAAMPAVPVIPEHQ